MGPDKRQQCCRNSRRAGEQSACQGCGEGRVSLGCVTGMQVAPTDEGDEPWRRVRSGEAVQTAPCRRIATPKASAASIMMPFAIVVNRTPDRFSCASATATLPASSSGKGCRVRPSGRGQDTAHRRAARCGRSAAAGHRIRGCEGQGGQARPAAHGSNLAQPRLVEDIAAHVGCSARKLQRRFLTDLGTTPSQAYMQLRLRAAARLPDRTDNSIEDVGAAVGFVNQGHFSRRFRAGFGISPTGYRTRDTAPPA